MKYGQTERLPIYYYYEWTWTLDNGHPSCSLIIRNNQTTVYLLHPHAADIAKETLIVVKSIMLEIEINVLLSSPLIFVSFLFHVRISYSFSLFLLLLLLSFFSLVPTADSTIPTTTSTFSYFQLCSEIWARQKLQFHSNGEFSRLEHVFFFFFFSFVVSLLH